MNIYFLKKSKNNQTGTTNICISLVFTCTLFFVIFCIQVSDASNKVSSYCKPKMSHVVSFENLNKWSSEQDHKFSRPSIVLHSDSALRDILVVQWIKRTKVTFKRESTKTTSCWKSNHVWVESRIYLHKNAPFANLFILVCFQEEIVTRGDICV